MKQDEKQIDCRLIMLYKATYDIVAMPFFDYLTSNLRLSRHNHQLAYRQIPALMDCYK